MGLFARNPVLGVSDKVRLKLVCSASKTSYNILISLVASFDMILSNKQITKALIRQRGCAGWYAFLLFGGPKDRVSRVGVHLFLVFCSW